MYPLGRNRPDPTFTPKLLRFGDFIQPSKLRLPKGIWKQDWAPHAIAGLEDPIGNRKWGNCFPSAVLKANDLMLANTRPPPYVFATEAQSAWLYSQCTTPPFDPVTGNNDNGTADDVIMSRWVNEGLFADGSGKAETVVIIDATSPTELAAAQYLLGHTISALDMPDSVAKNQPDTSGFVWGDVSMPGNINNGHAMVQYGINMQGLFDSTWGLFGTVTFEWVAQYCSPPWGFMYAALGGNWKVVGQEKSPAGVAWSDLEAQVAALPKFA